MIIKIWLNLDSNTLNMMNNIHEIPYEIINIGNKYLGLTTDYNPNRKHIIILIPK